MALLVKFQGAHKSGGEMQTEASEGVDFALEINI